MGGGEFLVDFEVTVDDRVVSKLLLAVEAVMRWREVSLVRG